MGTFLTEFSYIHMLIILILIYLFFYLVILRKSIVMKCKINRYSVKKNMHQLKIIKYIYCIYSGIIRSISLFIMKIPAMSKYVNEYKPYVNKINKKDIIPADFISNKILLSAIFLLLICIVGSIDGNMVTDAEVIVFTLLGYVLPDLYYYIKYDNNREK